jgi:nucleoside-diphosphate-sugar epimerase
MRVLVLGGTGSVGGPIVRELVRAGHEVSALARSERAASRLAALGARAIAGDIRTPDSWVPALPPFDGVVHAAATFSADEEAVDKGLLDRLLPHLSRTLPRTRFVYTGGCWLFGPAGTAATTEESPFEPLPVFAWAVGHCRRVLAANGIVPLVIHPGMVYEPTSGCFARFREDALQRRAVRVVGGEGVRWPLVHAEDLAVLYRLVLERGEPAASYIGVAIDAMPVGRIACAFARRFATPTAVPEVVSEDEVAAELGEWARGYGFDQWQSGARARRTLGWTPTHLDPENEIAALP